MTNETITKLKEYVEALKTIKKEKQNQESKFIQSEVYKCTLNNGQTILREKLLKSGHDGSAVIILAITKDKKVILAIEPRVFLPNTVGINLPAGYIEKDEDSKVAALRELQEETGYTSKKLIHLGSFYQDIGCSMAYNHMFLAKEAFKVSEQNLDEGEFIKYFECSFEDLLELVESDYIQDANSLLTIEKAKKYMKRR